MKEKEMPVMIESLGKKLPKFPDGRIDYSKSDVAIVITVFVSYRNKILIMKRSDKVGTYKGKWHTVAGYLDEPKPIKEKIMEELREEVGVLKDIILSIRIGKTFEIADKSINKKWIVNPVMVRLREKPEIKLDWEHTEFRWIKKEELKDFDIVPGIHKTLEKLL